MNKKLLLRYIAGELTDEEKVKVVRWIDASVENMNEFLALRKLHDITLWQNSSSNERNNKYSYRISPKKIAVEFFKIAAVLVVAFIIFNYNDHGSSGNESTQTLYVPPGQRALLTLSDSSRVWLNANSTFTFPGHFSNSYREVTLEGEGYFEVVHNASHPFVVKTEKYDIKVLGTEFNVMAYPGNKEFEVSLLKGEVEVVEPGEDKGLVMMPGQLVYLKDNRLHSSAIQHANYYLWKEGVISFDDELFPEMVKKLELCFNVKIIVKNEKILKYRCTGKFRISDGIEHILKVLQLKNEFSYTIDDKLNVIIIE